METLNKAGRAYSDLKSAALRGPTLIRGNPVQLSILNFIHITVYYSDQNRPTVHNWCLQGVWKRTSGIKWVNLIRTSNYFLFRVSYKIWKVTRYKLTFVFPVKSQSKKLTQKHSLNLLSYVEKWVSVIWNQFKKTIYHIF